MLDNGPISVLFEWLQQSVSLFVKGIVPYFHRNSQFRFEHHRKHAQAIRTAYESTTS